VADKGTEASRERPRNVPASLCTRPPAAAGATSTGVSSTGVAETEQTPDVQFGTRKRSVPLATLCTLCMWFFCEFNHMVNMSMIKNEEK